MLGDDNEKKESEYTLNSWIYFICLDDLFFFFSLNKIIGVLNDNHNEQTTVYGIHDELRRLRLRLNKERPKLVRII